MKPRLRHTISAGIFSCLSTATPAALIDNGGGLIYDDVLNITWSQPIAVNSPIALISWDDSNTWAAGLTLGGVSGWRLPDISVTAGAGPFTGTPIDCNTASAADCQDNELGYMFYHNLGGTFQSSILNSGDPDLALFPTLLPAAYWSTGFNSEVAWVFGFGNGAQGVDVASFGNFAWAVHAGNVGSVPVPAAVWLFCSGLLGLIGIARHK